METKIDAITADLKKTSFIQRDVSFVSSSLRRYSLGQASCCFTNDFPLLSLSWNSLYVPLLVLSTNTWCRETFSRKVNIYEAPKVFISIGEQDILISIQPSFPYLCLDICEILKSVFPRRKMHCFITIYNVRKMFLSFVICSTSKLLRTAWRSLPIVFGAASCCEICMGMK